MADSQQGKPDPQRVAILRSLPLEVKEQLTGEEAEAFMYNRELPESLLEKLKDYLVEEQLDHFLCAVPIKNHANPAEKCTPQGGTKKSGISSFTKFGFCNKQDNNFYVTKGEIHD